jgi:NADP-dependent 3-hydroxy acid dehydrogenase YdfG
MDMNPFGIKVTSINPGLVETEFAEVRFKGDKERASSVYKGMVPLKGEDIADIIQYVLSAPAHVVLADITVFPTAQASSTIVKRAD